MPNNIDYKPSAFDCFAGDSVGGFVMSYLGAKFSGTELREEQARLNNERVDAFNLDAKYHCDDGRNIAKYLQPESQDLFFSCPPYFDLEHYSDDERDASNQGSYEEFLGLLDTAFSESIKCLKKNRFAIVVMSAVRDKDGFYQDIPSDITRIFEKNGCHLYNQIILVDTGATLALRVGNSMKNRKVGRQHQEVLVYLNGEESPLEEDINEFKTVGRIHQNIAVYYKPDEDSNIQKDFKDLRSKKNEN
jgi:DNA modification methylase